MTHVRKGKLRKQERQTAAAERLAEVQTLITKAKDGDQGAVYALQVRGITV